MRIIALLILLSVASGSIGQLKNPFLTLKFDKVVMYDYEPHSENPSLLGSNGQLLKTVAIKKQIQPGQLTIENLNKRIGQKESYGQSTAMCFEPHLGIVYYLQGKAVGNVLICLGCNRLRSSIDIPAQKQGKHGQGANAYYLGEGMSKSFRKFINDVLKKYNFSHQVTQGNSMFDG